MPRQISKEFGVESKGFSLEKGLKIPNSLFGTFIDKHSKEKFPIEISYCII